MDSINELIEFYKNFWKQSKAAADRYRANTKLKHCREGLIKESANLECYAGFINHLTALEKKFKVSLTELSDEKLNSGQLHKPDVVWRSEPFYCVSSDALVYGKPCEQWCGNPHCKTLVKQ